MSVRSKEEIIAQVSSRIGDDTSDEAIALIEDISDTLDALTDKNGDGKDWKAEASRIEKEWREKYKARFTSSSDKDDPSFDDKGVPDKDYTYENLFKEKE